MSAPTESHYEDWLRRLDVAVCRGADGGHDRHGVPAPGEAPGRLWSRRHRDGVVGGPRARHRSHARVRGYTEEERPVSIQIFGGDPAKMADAAQIVEGMGADIVDVNMGCPVPKISKHNAGCSLMRDPGARGARRRRDGQGGEDSRHREDARRLERPRSQRAAACADGAGRRRRGGDDSRTDGGAVVQGTRRLGSRLARRDQPRHPCARQRRLRRARADHRSPRHRRQRCAGRTRCAAQSVDSRAGGRRGVRPVRRER